MIKSAYFLLLQNFF